MPTYALTVFIEGPDNSEDTLYKVGEDLNIDSDFQITSVYVAPAVIKKSSGYYTLASGLPENVEGVSYPTSPPPDDNNWAWDTVNRTWVQLS